MRYTDDPIRDFERHDIGQARSLQRLPVCSECGEPIQDEHCFEFNDELICEQCLNQNHRKYVDDYIL